jgi:predicted chitinase
MYTLQQLIDRNEKIPYDDTHNSPLVADQALTREIQTILKKSGFYRDSVDGLYGGITLRALRDFKEARSLSGGDVLGPTTASYLLHSRDARPSDAAPTTRDGAIQMLTKECKRMGLTLPSQIAYVLATVEHETNNTFMPVREAYWLSENWRANNLWYYPYYGRGYVQLTHRSNYAQYSSMLGVDFVNNPDLVMQPNYSAFILVDGMLHGRFTTRYLAEFVAADRTDFYNARRVINGTDKADHIAQIAKGWLNVL